MHQCIQWDQELDIENVSLHLNFDANFKGTVIIILIFLINH